MILSPSHRNCAGIGTSLPLEFFSVSRRRAARRRRVDFWLTEAAKYMVLTAVCLVFAMMFVGVL